MRRPQRELVRSVRYPTTGSSSDSTTRASASAMPSTTRGESPPSSGICVGMSSPEGGA